MKTKLIATGIFVFSLITTSVFAQDATIPESNQQYLAVNHQALNISLNQGVTVVNDINQNALKVQLDDRIANNKAKVLLYNAKGGLIKAQTMKNNNTTVFSMDNQRQGLYIVRYVQEDGQIVTKKIYYQ